MKVYRKLFMSVADTFRSELNSRPFRRQGKTSYTCLMNRGFDVYSPNIDKGRLLWRIYKKSVSIRHLLWNLVMRYHLFRSLVMHSDYIIFFDFSLWLCNLVVKSGYFSVLKLKKLPESLFSLREHAPTPMTQVPIFMFDNSGLLGHFQ